MPLILALAFLLLALSVIVLAAGALPARSASTALVIAVLAVLLLFAHVTGFYRGRELAELAPAEAQP